MYKYIIFTDKSQTAICLNVMYFYLDTYISIFIYTDTYGLGKRIFHASC